MNLLTFTHDVGTPGTNMAYVDVSVVTTWLIQCTTVWGDFKRTVSMEAGIQSIRVKNNTQVIVHFLKSWRTTSIMQ